MLSFEVLEVTGVFKSYGDPLRPREVPYRLDIVVVMLWNYYRVLLRPVVFFINTSLSEPDENMKCIDPFFTKISDHKHILRIMKLQRCPSGHQLRPV